VAEKPHCGASGEPIDQNCFDKISNQNQDFG
jgi:hypothetical protein